MSPGNGAAPHSDQVEGPPNRQNDAASATTDRIPTSALPTQLMWDVAAGVVVPIVDPLDVDDATHRVLLTRNITAVTGTCPECGARATLPSRRRRRAARVARVHLRITVVHEDGCPAGDATVPNYGDVLTSDLR